MASGMFHMMEVIRGHVWARLQVKTVQMAQMAATVRMARMVLTVRMELLHS